MQAKYSFENYDQNLCLRVNGTLWFILLFLLRPYLVTVLSLTDRSDKTAIISMVYSDKMALWWALLAGVPAVLVVYAWVKRKPGPPSFARMLWHRGRALLAASSIFSVAVVFVPLWMGVGYRVSMAGWIQLVLSIGVVVMLYSSTYIRDCFSSYPGEADADNSG